MRSASNTNCPVCGLQFDLLPQPVWLPEHWLDDSPLRYCSGECIDQVQARCQEMWEPYRLRMVAALRARYLGGDFSASAPASTKDLLVERERIYRETNEKIKADYTAAYAALARELAEKGEANSRVAIYL